MRSTLAALVSVACLTTPITGSAGGRSPQHAGVVHCRLVESVGGLLHACVRGEGPHVVVFEAGMRETGATWRELVRLLGEGVTTVAYDRAGSGQSPERSGPRTSAQLAGELNQLLRALGLGGPFLLVGHSAGGWHVVEFARQFPDLARAVVLLDSPHPDFEPRRLELLSDAERRERRAALDRSRRGLPAAVQREYLGLEDTRRDWKVTPVTLRVPLVVVGAGRHEWVPPDKASLIEDAWQEGQRAWCRMSSRCRLVPAPGLGHYVHVEAPEFVARLVQEILRVPVSSGVGTGADERLEALSFRSRQPSG